MNTGYSGESLLTSRSKYLSARISRQACLEKGTMATVKGILGEKLKLALVVTVFISLFTAAIVIGVTFESEPHKLFEWFEQRIEGNKNNKNAMLTSERAKSIAEDLTGGRAVRAALIRRGSQPIFQVTLMKNRKKEMLLLDARTGRRI